MHTAKWWAKRGPEPMSACIPFVQAVQADVLEWAVHQVEVEAEKYGRPLNMNLMLAFRAKKYPLLATEQK